MLQANKPLTPLGEVERTKRAAPEFHTLFQRFVLRQLPVIAVVTVVTVALGAIYVLNTPPSFTAQATMIIDTHKVNIFQQQSIIGDLPIDSATVESQVEILKSDNIALAVIRKLNLTQNPELVGPGGGLVGGVFALVGNWVGDQGPASDFELTRRAARAFSDRLAIKRVGLTYIIEIDFRAHSPQLAAQVANAVADAYIADQLDAKYQATQRASVWLQDRIRELREQSSGAEKAVVDFKTQNNIVDTGKGLMNEQQLSELNSQLVLAQARTAEMQARLDRIQQIIKSDVSDATVTDSLQNEVITKLRQQYLDLKAKEADWSARYGPNHMAAVNLRNQMFQIRRSIVDELGRIAETFKSDYEIAKQREAALQTGLAQAVSSSQTTNQAQVAMHELESSAQSYKTLYDNFLQRYMESVQQQSFPITEARVITPASPPFQKSHPKTSLILSVCLLAGLLMGVGVGRLRDLMERVFRTGSDVEEALNATCIGIVPILGQEGKKAAPPPRQTGPVVVGERTITRTGEGLLWRISDFPFSRASEATRSIKVAVDLFGARKSTKVIGITSTLPNEGKSTNAAALVQIMAQGGARALLVDADLRNPSLTRRLTPQAKVGLIDVLMRKATIDEAIWTDPSTNMRFLPAGQRLRLAQTHDILGSDRTKEVFDELRARFDYVVIDLSPLAPVVDVRAMTHMVDSFVYVIEWGRTKIDAVEHALAEAPGVYENLVGVVLNKANIGVLNRYESYRGNYYYNKYYSRYGYTD